LNSNCLNKVVLGTEYPGWIQITHLYGFCLEYHKQMKPFSIQTSLLIKKAHKQLNTQGEA